VKETVSDEAREDQWGVCSIDYCIYRSSHWQIAVIPDERIV